MCLRRQGPRCAGWDKSSIFSHVPFFGFLSGLEGVFSCQYIIELSKAGVIFFWCLIYSLSDAEELCSDSNHYKCIF